MGVRNELFSGQVVAMQITLRHSVAADHEFPFLALFQDGSAFIHDIGCIVCERPTDGDLLRWLAQAYGGNDGRFRGAIGVIDSSLGREPGLDECFGQRFAHRE